MLQHNLPSGPHFCSTCRDTGSAGDAEDSDSHDCYACGGSSFFKRQILRLEQLGFPAKSHPLDALADERAREVVEGRRAYFDANDSDRPRVIAAACRHDARWAWSSGVFAEVEDQREGRVRPCGRSRSLCQEEDCSCQSGK